MEVHRRQSLASVGEIMFPARCAGCGNAGDVVCVRCRERLATPPVRISTTTPVGVPVFACGTYADAHRGVILRAKENRHLSVRPYVGAVLDSALKFLRAQGQVPDSFTLIPAPTRVRAARLRGGDPVTDFCLATSFPVSPVVHTQACAVDQTELSASERRVNMMRSVQLSAAPPPGPLILIDDVITTGATLAATCARLTVAGGTVVAALALAYA